MEKKYDVIGIMSGTSLDGVDIAYCSFQKKRKWVFEILIAETFSYPPQLFEKLKKSTHLPATELLMLDHELGSWIGQRAKTFIKREKLRPLFIATHGHTIFHQPEKGFTYQIGNLYEIYKIVRMPVIGDFRSLDVALGGQGAPLVPIGDALLFSDFDFCLNLGGFSNICCDKKGKRIAFDVCPVNTVLNHLAGKKGLEYDIDGKLGLTGKLDEELYQKLNGLEYYHLPAPKSLGIEWVHDRVFPLLDRYGSSIENQLFTFYKHISCQIGQAVNKNLKSTQTHKLLLTGGGTFNPYLVSEIQNQLDKNVEVSIPDHRTIAYKEALIFAFLGLLRWQNKINTLKSVTGSEFDSSGGIIINNLITGQNLVDNDRQSIKLRE